MKTTMKNHENLNKINRAVRKITMNLILASLVLAFASCEKEEIFQPFEEATEVDESVKATFRIAPELSLQIRLRTKNVPYDRLWPNHTVRFNESFWGVTPETTGGVRRSQIWSSPNGSDWTPRRNNPFPMTYVQMVVHDGKIWAIGQLFNDPYQIYSSRDGFRWNREKASLPFTYLSSIKAVVFNNKIFVFERLPFNTGLRVQSSPDGINWTLENANPFPQRSSGTVIVFKNTLYYMGGGGNMNHTFNEIWKSTNGRDWSLVPGATPSILRPTEDFPAKSNFAAVVHNNAVWVTGGPRVIEGDAAQGKDIWVSGDMQNWEKYTGHVKFKPYVNPTMLSYKNEILLLGGYYHTGPRTYEFSKSIWSIKPKSSVRFPVEIPREDIPTIPRF